MAYDIKCSECKAKIGETDSVAESAAGGRCEGCRSVWHANIAAAQVRDLHLAAVTSIGVERNSSTVASVVVRMRTGRLNRAAEITYDRGSDTYTVRRSTMRGRSAASHTLEVFPSCYADSLLTVLTAGGFDGQIK